jgi:hypothetical protein
VYYDPDNPGPFEDGQDALSNVPDGGTFWLATGTYDVSTEGALTLDRPVHVRGSGEGWSRLTERSDGDRTLTPLGTVIDNGNRDSPAIEFVGSAPERTLNGASIRGLTVEHGGESSPAVRFKDTINTTVADTRVTCGSKAPTGIKYEGRGFFANVTRSVVTAFTDIGIHVAGSGYAHEFYSVWCASGRPDATALQTERHRTIVVGGEFACLGDNGTAIRFYNPGNSPRYGGFVVEPGIEHTHNPVDIDGEGAFENVQLYHLLMPSQNADTTAVRFGNAKNCKLINPIIQDAKRGAHLAHWSGDAEHCGIVSDAGTLTGCTVSDDGARNPYVSVTGATDDMAMEQLPTSVPITVEYNTDAGSPLFHDGQGWKQTAAKEYSSGGN